ncbi:MAG: hypothetical protein NZ959_09565 [Armatimonadetes bacterium]|nr:hypothetical protein [Armatimonadota bacterium]MDW8122719.1 hypothetical protein [Armatimonadota bacterium]
MDESKKGGIALTQDEQDILKLEVEALIPVLSQERQPPYRRLAQAIEDGWVAEELEPYLDGLLTLALETGRARSLYRAEGERVLTDLFRRTTRGQALTRQVEQINRSLRVLRGQNLQSLRVGFRTLGSFSLLIETESAIITLTFSSDSVQVDSLSVGGEAGLG